MIIMMVIRSNKNNTGDDNDSANENQTERYWCDDNGYSDDDY